MLAPSKDTIVLLISMLLALSILVFGRNLRPTVLLFLGLDVLYGIFIRKYYLLVVGAWTVLYFVFLKPRRYAWIAAIAAVVIALAMPDGTAELLQSPRDTSNAYANIVGSDNRTAFTNLVPPTNGLNFLLNYGVRCVRSGVPVLLLWCIVRYRRSVVRLCRARDSLPGISGSWKEGRKSSPYVPGNASRSSPSGSVYFRAGRWKFCSPFVINSDLHRCNSMGH